MTVRKALTEIKASERKAQEAAERGARLTTRAHEFKDAQEYGIAATLFYEAADAYAEASGYLGEKMTVVTFLNRMYWRCVVGVVLATVVILLVAALA